MEELKNIEKTLIEQVQMHLYDLKHINVQELGAVVDMIKDLEKAMYYNTVIHAMKEAENSDNCCEDEKQVLSSKLQNLANKNKEY